MAQATNQLFGVRLEIYHPAPRTQPLAIFWPQNRTAAGGQHTRTLLTQRVDDFGFNIPKARLTFALKELTNGTPQARLNRLVRIGKRQLQAPCELSADSGFSGAGEADEGDQTTNTVQKVTVVFKPEGAVTVTEILEPVQSAAALRNSFKVM